VSGTSVRASRSAAAAVLLLAAVGCSQPAEPPASGSTNGATASGTAAAPAAAASEGGLVGLQVDVPAEWSTKDRGNRTDFLNRQGRHFSIWALPEGTSLDAAVRDVASEIAEKVTGFEPSPQGEETVAGAKATHVSGPGTEQDDGDPSRAEVFVFELGGRVRVLCAHGEGDAAERLAPVALEILGTARPR